MRQRRDAVVLVMLGFFLLLTHYFYSQSIPTDSGCSRPAVCSRPPSSDCTGANSQSKAFCAMPACYWRKRHPSCLSSSCSFLASTDHSGVCHRIACSGLTGLSERMAPGSLNNLIQSGSIAFRTQFSDTCSATEPAVLARSGTRLYDGQRPDVAACRYAAEAPGSRASKLAKQRSRAPPTLEAHNQRWLLALDLPLCITEREAQPFISTRSPVQRRRAQPEPLHLYIALDAVANRQEISEILRHAQSLPGTLNLAQPPAGRHLARTLGQP